MGQTEVQYGKAGGGGGAGTAYMTMVFPVPSIGMCGIQKFIVTLTECKQINFKIVVLL